MGPLLVVVKPANVHRPWVQELLNRDNFDRSMSFYIHHSSMAAEFAPVRNSDKLAYRVLKDKKSSATEIQQFDIVLTTYSTLMIAWTSGTNFNLIISIIIVQ